MLAVCPGGCRIGSTRRKPTINTAPSTANTPTNREMKNSTACDDPHFLVPISLTIIQPKILLSYFNLLMQLATPKAHLNLTHRYVCKTLCSQQQSKSARIKGLAPSGAKDIPLCWRISRMLVFNNFMVYITYLDMLASMLKLKLIMPVCCVDAVEFTI